MSSAKAKKIDEFTIEQTKNINFLLNKTENTNHKQTYKRAKSKKLLDCKHNMKTNSEKF